MAAFFKVPASAGIVVRAARPRPTAVVVRAEHLFNLRLRPVTRAGQLTCRWTHDADGRLILSWEAGPAPQQAAAPATSTAA